MDMFSTVNIHMAFKTYYWQHRHRLQPEPEQGLQPGQVQPGQGLQPGHWLWQAPRHLKQLQWKREWLQLKRRRPSPGG